MALWLIGLVVWFYLGWLGVKKQKRGFTESGWRWDKDDEAMGRFLVLLGPFNLLAAVICYPKKKKNFRSWF